MPPSLVSRPLPFVIALIVALSATAHLASSSSDVTPWTSSTPPAVHGMNPPQVTAPSLADDPADDYSVLFGGTNGVWDLNQTWTFSGDSWTNRTTSAAPPAGNGLSMTYDATDGYLLLADFVQTWSFLHGTWTNRTASAGIHPNVTTAFIAFDPTANETVLFGQDHSTYRSYTYVYAHGVWQNDTIGPQPGYSSSETLVWDSTTRQLLLVGCSAISSFSDGTWTQVQVIGSTCDTGGVNVADDPGVSGLVAFGGWGGIYSGAAGGGETWTFVNHTWRSEALTPCPQEAGGAAGMTYDAGARDVVLFGGAGGPSAETWLFVNDSWRNVTAIPTAESGEVSLLPFVVGAVIVFGALIAVVAIRRRRAS